MKRLLVEAAQEAVRARYTDAAWAALPEAERLERLTVFEIDCWNHLRNVWLAKGTSALTARLKEIHKEELDTIDFRLRVSSLSFLTNINSEL